MASFSDRLGGITPAGFAAMGGGAPARRRLKINPDGTISDETGKAVSMDSLTNDDRADLLGMPSPGQPQASASPGGSFADVMTQQGPPSHNFLDASRSQWSPQGAKTVDEALAKSLAEGRRTGESGGFAIQGPGGRYFTSNAEADAARAASANPMDQFRAFKDMARQAGVYVGQGGSDPNAVMKMFGEFQKGSAQSKTAEAALEDMLAKQYGLATRGPQEDVTKLREAEIRTRGQVESSRIEADARKEAAKLGIKGQITAEQTRQIGALLAEGRTEEANALKKFYAQATAEADATRQGNPPPTTNAGNDFTEARSTRNLRVALGFEPSGKDKNTGKDKFNTFDPDLLVGEVMRNPDLMKSSDFKAMIKKAGGGVTPEALKQAVGSRLLRGVLPNELASANLAGPNMTSGGMGVPGGVTIVPRRTGNVSTRYDIQGPGGQTLFSEEGASSLPFADYLSGRRRMFPRLFVDENNVRRENEILASILQSLGG